jgi:hypothetical protein
VGGSADVAPTGRRDGGGREGEIARSSSVPRLSGHPSCVEAIGAWSFHATITVEVRPPLVKSTRIHAAFGHTLTDQPEFGVAATSVADVAPNRKDARPPRTSKLCTLCSRSVCAKVSDFEPGGVPAGGGVVGALGGLWEAGALGVFDELDELVGLGGGDVGGFDVGGGGDVVRFVAEIRSGIGAGAVTCAARVAVATGRSSAVRVGAFGAWKTVSRRTLRTPSQDSATATAVTASQTETDVMVLRTALILSFPYSPSVAGGAHECGYGSEPWHRCSWSRTTNSYARR